MKKHFARLLLPLGVLCAAAALLFYPTQAAAGAKRGIGYCVDILIPSLFPFMALSVFVVKSGLAASMGRLTAGPCRILFGLPGSAAAAIVMSMVGGYPVGARAVAALCQEGEITPQEAARMLCFCVNSGPAFVLSVVGAGLLRNAQAGVILLASQLSASLLLGILCSLGVSRKQRGKAVSQKGMGAAQALICSASDAARSMLSMCCFVILFAVLLDLLRVFLSSPTASTFVSILLEVTGGCNHAVQQGLPYGSSPLPSAGAASACIFRFFPRSPASRSAYPALCCFACFTACWRAGSPLASVSFFRRQRRPLATQPRPCTAS